MRDLLLHRLELANSPDQQEAPAADQAQGVIEPSVDPARHGELIDGQWIELTGADSLDAIGRAFAGLAQLRAKQAERRQADGQAVTGGSHGR